MKPVFRLDLEEMLGKGTPISLELGCGARMAPGRICIDHLDMPHVDIVADLEEGLPFLPDNSVDSIHSKSLLEHIDHLDVLMRDIWRVLKPEGRKHLFVPHFSNPYYYSDFTHQRFFGLYSFEYFSGSPSRFKRKVPSFYQEYGFVTEELTLVFTSPWRARKLLKRAAQRIFNFNTWLQEFYEENLCYLIPCSGIEAVLRPEKSA